MLARIRNMSARTRRTESIVKMIPPDLWVWAVRSGVILTSRMKANVCATELMRPQLIDSPTPSGAVYSTASSKETKIIA